MRMLSGDRLQREMAEMLAPAMRAIASSLGPDGRHVVFTTGNRVDSARTGSEIARRICPDHYAGRLLKEMLVDAERQFGDGTARLAVMAGAALREGQRAMASGLPAAAFLHALDALRPALDAAFAGETRPAGPADDLLAAAGLTSGLSRLLAEADALAGPEGLISVAEGAENSVRAAEGFEFDCSFAGTAPLAAMEAVHLIVANEVISDFQSLAPVIEAFATRGKALVIVARGLEGNALQLIEKNRAAGVIRMAALMPADAGPRAAEILADLAAACGAGLVCASLGRSISAFRPAMLGQAARFSLTKGRARLQGCNRDPAEVALRLAAAEAAIAANRYLPFDREHAERRRARLLGRGAEVRIARGPEAPALLEAARRAVVNLRTSRAGGVIAGGGLGAGRIADAVLRLRDADPGDPAAAAAIAMADAALRAPGRCLSANAGSLAGEGSSQGNPGQRDRGLTEPGLTDPAGLSRDLLEIALSFATRLAGIEGAVLRH